MGSHATVRLCTHPALYQWLSNDLEKCANRFTQLEADLSRETDKCLQHAQKSIRQSEQQARLYERNQERKKELDAARERAERLQMEEQELLEYEREKQRAIAEDVEKMEAEGRRREQEEREREEMEVLRRQLQEEEPGMF